MADIQFDEEQQYQRPVQPEQKPIFIRLVLSTKVVSTDREAQFVLLGIAALALILSFIIPSLIRSAPPKMTPEQRHNLLMAPQGVPR